MRNIKPKTSSEKGYLIYRLPVTVEEGDLENREWEERINRIEKILKNNKDEGENKTNSLNQQAEIMKESFEQKLNQAMNNIEERMSKTTNEIKENVKNEMKNIGDQVGTMKESFEQKVNEMKSMGDQVGKLQNDIQDLKELVNLLLDKSK